MSDEGWERIVNDDYLFIIINDHQMQRFSPMRSEHIAYQWHHTEVKPQNLVFKWLT